MMKSRQDKTFPSHGPFRRLKQQLITKVINYSKDRGWEDVVKICEAACVEAVPEVEHSPASVIEEFGFVYLLKYRKYYKIGRTNSTGRRERELSIQLPQKTTMDHSIKTDDPAGIEAYWHKGFAEKRTQGEWFELTPADVSTFKRRKFM